MTVILGISAFYHDAAAALLVDGEIVAAAQEERFTRIKHDSAFPQKTVEYCLRQAKLTTTDIDHVVFYEKPFLKFERLLETHLAVAPTGFQTFLKAMPLWIHKKLRLPQVLNEGLHHQYHNRFIFPEHHESHAASAFFPSPFEDAAILISDGVGEWATASMGHGAGNRVHLTHEMHFPHSLGLLYSAFTYHCGFKVNSGEYKLMGLAPYGVPRYCDRILQHLIDLKADGSFRLDQSYFNYCAGLTMTSAKFSRLFETPPREPEAELTQRHLDLASSVQQVTELIMLRMATKLHQLTGSKNLCLAGGVALNCVSNGRLLRESPFERIWIQPAAGDAGGALGAALFAWYQLLESPRHPQLPDSQKGSLLGPEYESDEITAILLQQQAVYRFHADDHELCDRVAALVASGLVVGWVQGRMEYGPRALGNRSILGDARDPAMQSRMNQKIKFRESFRPFAPIVLHERASEYFTIQPGQESPYMLQVAAVREEKRLTRASNLIGLAMAKEPSSVIPAVTHVDYSARLQTVDARRNPRLHQLLSAFDRQTGCPVMINTSFNVRGEPIVCSPEDAYRCFMATNMDALVIGNFVLLKDEQPATAHVDSKIHLDKFAAD